MTQIYQQTAFSISLWYPEAVAWWQHVLTCAEDQNIKEYPEAVLSAAREYGLDLDACSCLGTWDLDEEEKQLNVESDHYFDPELWAVLIQAYLRIFNLGNWNFDFQYSISSSKPDEGAFGGGAFRISTDKIRSMTTTSWLDEVYREEERISRD